MGNAIVALSYSLGGFVAAQISRSLRILARQTFHKAPLPNPSAGLRYQIQTKCVKRIMKTDPLFYGVRHGETANNDKGLYRGWSNAPDAQLSAGGRDLVREAGFYLRNLNIKFPFIVSDDLDRCTETREILASILGIQHQVTDKRLRPINTGEFTGKSKADFPLDEYFKNPNKKIPGGGSIEDFHKMQASLFADVLTVVSERKCVPLVVGHGSTVSYLHNCYNRTEPLIGYEGLTNPGGVWMFNKNGVLALTHKRDGVPHDMKDGTALTGFVTDEENKPPRECWNCRNFIRDPLTKTGGCSHPLVQIDPQLQDRRQNDNTIAVGDRDCCDNFRNKV
jgi:broad specificity phosphatase PhoE